MSFYSLNQPILRRICGEYLEMPGLRLTRQQAQRLWGLDEVTCAKSLDFLVGIRFLVRTGNDSYIRRAEGPVAPHLPMARLGRDQSVATRLRRARSS